jgi:hypothetical protein
MPTLPRVKNFDPISPGKLSCRRDRNETDRAADSDISGGIVLVECRLFGDAVVERVVHGYHEHNGPCCPRGGSP